MTTNPPTDSPESPESPETDETLAAETPEGDEPIQFVADLTPIPHQIGERLIESLSTSGTVAVLATIVTGLHRDRLVLVPLDREQIAGVQQVIDDIQSADEEDVSHIGFQHVIAKRQADEDAEEDGEDADG